MMAVVLRSFVHVRFHVPADVPPPLIYDSLAHSGPHNSRLIPLPRSVRRYYLILCVRARDPVGKYSRNKENVGEEEWRGRGSKIISFWGWWCFEGCVWQTGSVYSG